MYSDEEESLIFGPAAVSQKEAQTDFEQRTKQTFFLPYESTVGSHSQLERCHHPDYILEQVFPRALYIVSSVLMMIDFYVSLQT